MTEGLVKETVYSEFFKKTLTGKEPGWLKDLRERAFAYFTKNGFPVVQNEEWKYTNVAPIARENWSVADSAASAQNVQIQKSDFARAQVSELIFDESRTSVLVFTNGIFDRNLSNPDALKDATILSF